MILGTFYALCTGILWAGIGVIISRIARANDDFIAFMAASSLIMAVCGWVIVPDHVSLISIGESRLIPLFRIMVAAGVLGAVATIALYRSMQIGHHGMSWTIAQTALVFPYVLGVLIWNDQTGRLQVCGVLTIVIAIIVLGYTHREQKIANESRRDSWLVIALCSLFLFGGQQTLTTMPSRWTEWGDPAHLRVPVYFTGSAAGFLLISFLTRRFPERWFRRDYFILALVTLPSHLLLYRALDHFAESAKVGLVYPIAVGSCIVSFALYSGFILRESFPPLRIFGVVLGAIGVMLTALQ